MVKQRQQILLMLLLWVTLLTHTVTIRVHASTPDVIHIAIAKNIPPYSFVDNQGEVKGLLIDYWRLWARKLNKDIEFVSVNWQDSIPALKTDRIDIHFGLLDAQDFYPSGAKVFPFYKALTRYYFKKDSNINSLIDLKGKRIGIINIPVYKKHLEQKLPFATVLKFNSFDELFLAAQNNEIDAFLNETVTTWHQLVSRYQYQDFKALDDFEAINFFYALTQSNNRDMKYLIQQGMNKISEQEMIKIEQRWIFNQQLQLLANTNKQSLLSKQERQWLERQPTAIQIGSIDQWAPWMLRDNSNQRVGLNVDLINLINSNLATNIELKYYVIWADALTDVINDRLDGVLSLSKTAEREQKIIYSPSYYYTAHELVVQQDNNSITSLADLATKRVAAFKGHVLTEQIEQDIATAEIVYVTSISQAYQMLKDNQVDAAVGTLFDLEQLRKLGLKVATSIESDIGNLHIGIAKSQPMLGKIITKGINSITSQQRSWLFDKWVTSFNKQSKFSVAEHRFIANNTTITVGIEPWPPIIFSDDGKKVNGIVGELLQHVTKSSGLSFKLVTGEWADLLADFKLGKIDLLPSASFSEKRAKFGLYGDGYLELAASIFVLETLNRIESLSDLSELTLAIVKGDALIDPVQRLFPEINIVLTPNTANSISRLLSGEVNAIFGLEAVVASQLITSLTTGVKLIRQTDIAAGKLHFLSRLGQPLLQSVLNKSLASIDKSQRFEIFERWIGRSQSKKLLNIAFGLGREPYVIEKRQVKGIEYDLLKQIFSISNIDIVATNALSIPQLNSALDDFPSVDAVANVSEISDNHFYAGGFIHFNNVVITSKASRLAINSLADLKGKSILAFDNAYKYLGDEYFALFNPQQRPDSYQESVYLGRQFNDLLSGAVDAVVIDKTIFQWFAAKAGYGELDLFSFHQVFPETIDLGVNFRDKTTRDIFRKNLAELKRSGHYQHIIDGYTSGQIVKKVEFSSIVAALASEFMLLEDKSQLQAILDLLTSLPYINKIEAFNTNDRLLYSSSKHVSKFYQQRDSFNLYSGVGTKVGYIRVYFDEQQVKLQLAQSKLIPEIAFYKKLPQYQSVWEVYRRFNFLDKQIEFSAREKNYLLAPPILTFSETNWQPLSIVTNEHFSGIMADYLALITQKTGIEFKYVPETVWLDAVKSFRQGDIDLLPGVDGNFYVDQSSASTDSYAKYRLAIVMNKNDAYVDDLKDLTGKNIALPKGHVSYKYIKTNYPDLEITITADVSAALQLVREGTADAFVGHLAIAAFQIENNFNGLSIVGQLDFEISHSILLKKGRPLLLSILNKTIASITPNQHRAIRNRWLKTSSSTVVDYRLIYQLVFVFCVIISLMLLVFKKLSKAKNLIEHSHIKLEQSLRELQQAQQQLVETEKMASLGGLVAGVAHEINTPVGIGLTAISHFSEISRKLTEKYHRNAMSKRDFDEFLVATDESAKIINRNLERTADLVKSFKQISVDQSSDERRTFNVKNYTDEILLSIHYITKKSQVKISLQCEEQLVINSYPGAFSQILSNLIINSTIHGYPNNEAGHISIKIREQDDNLILVYQDDGKGISHENLSKIFHPFFTTNRENGGSGLGLNIIYNIITNRLLGTITCNSEEGQGVEFIIRFKIIKG